MKKIKVGEKEGKKERSRPRFGLHIFDLGANFRSFSHLDDGMCHGQKRCRPSKEPGQEGAPTPWRQGQGSSVLARMAVGVGRRDAVGKPGPGQPWQMYWGVMALFLPGSVCTWTNPAAVTLHWTEPLDHQNTKANWLIGSCSSLLRYLDTKMQKTEDHCAIVALRNFLDCRLILPPGAPQITSPGPGLAGWRYRYCH